MLATTTYFTKGVNDFKTSRYDLDTKDFNGIIDWVQQYKLNETGSLYLKDYRLTIDG